MVSVVVYQLVQKPLLCLPLLLLQTLAASYPNLDAVMLWGNVQWFWMVFCGLAVDTVTSVVSVLLQALAEAYPNSGCGDAVGQHAVG
jgi:hypothetical protein